MKKKNVKKIEELVTECNAQIRGIEQIALKDENRAYGGIIRAGKGGLVEFLCRELIKIAWNEINGKEEILFFSDKKIQIPIKKEYISKITSPEIREWIKDNFNDFVFHAQVDIHVFIDNKFILGVECKSYTENAMLKRILVDFTLLKTIYPKLNCALLQLESQLTGDYSQPSKDIIFGSHSTHTLLSYFDVDLNIITLLDGERKVDKPIHKKEFYKPLKKELLIKTVEKFIDLLKSDINEIKY
ncbi:MAG: hypothetical protein LBS69_12705 [Prevotellaceae bacterium]|jgi:hypothetical protein|nr:hypothetical protein [Prevotellaceae bacterium]